MPVFCQKYVLSEPYPEIQGVNPDKAAAARVFPLFSGPSGELSGVCTYFYCHSRLSAQRFQELSDLFTCVSFDEMHHMELLSALICALGGDPKYIINQRGHKMWWNAGFVSYPQKPEEMLRSAIHDERMAVAEYQRVAQTLNGNARELLLRIARDEAHHAELFESALSRLKK